MDAIVPEPDLSSEAPNTTVLSTAEVTTAPARTRSHVTSTTVLTTVVPGRESQTKLLTICAWCWIM